jgi:hypothetical protein
MAVAAIFHDVMHDSLSVLTDISENPAVSSVMEMNNYSKDGRIHRDGGTLLADNTKLHPSTQQSI